MKYNALTPEEENIILKKGTEQPFSGKYWNSKDKGAYVCKYCNAPLFLSDYKFESHCGWPSFDDAIEGAVKQIPDADGKRTEILCANCGGHLGHIFTGEKLTEKDARYCVNSLSLNFITQLPSSSQEVAYFAGGCFWGVEYYFNTVEGVMETTVGYMGGNNSNPTYKEVCSGTTGHAEVLKVSYNPSVVSFETLAKLFFEIHDFTQVNRQGPDIGEQYRTEIFFTTPEQKETAQQLILLLKQKGYAVATQITQATPFWEGEQYHQDYYQKNGNSPYCHAQRKIF